MQTHSLFATAFVLLAACSLPGDDESSTSTTQRASADEPTNTAVSTPAGTPASVAPDPAAPAPAAPGAPPAGAPAKPIPDVGAIFMISNAVEGNEVIAFERASDGALSAAGRAATGGTGTARGIGSQGAVVLSPDGRYLLAVDPGSSELTTFAVDGTKLTLLSHVASGGVQPVSVTMHGNLVYVLNAGGAEGVSCITGFRLDTKGMLTAIPDSTHSLSAPRVGPAQVSFTPTGDALVVSEKATDVLDTFAVRADGTVSNGQALPSAGKTPFGFAFTPKGHLIVSEAFGGTAGAGALSSYSVTAPVGGEHGLLSITASAPDNQSAPCWVAITKDARFAFTSNTASDNLSTYTIDASGALTLSGEIAATTGDGSSPIDIALDRSTKHLYVLNAGTANLLTFDVGSDGSLKQLGSPVTVPATSVGLAAR